MDPSTPQNHLKTDISMWDTLYAYLEIWPSVLFFYSPSIIYLIETKQTSQQTNKLIHTINIIFVSLKSAKRVLLTSSGSFYNTALRIRDEGCSTARCGKGTYSSDRFNVVQHSK